MLQASTAKLRNLLRFRRHLGRLGRRVGIFLTNLDGSWIRADNFRMNLPERRVTHAPNDFVTGAL
jgi:hypothetical protein